MAKLHSKTVAVYWVNGRRIEADLCWQGDSPTEDESAFFDFYNERGVCLNEGNPWFADGSLEPPLEADVIEMLGG